MVWTPFKLYGEPKRGAIFLNLSESALIICFYNVYAYYMKDILVSVLNTFKVNVLLSNVFIS